MSNTDTMIKIPEDLTFYAVPDGVLVRSVYDMEAININHVVGNEIRDMGRVFAIERLKEVIKELTHEDDNFIEVAEDDLKKHIRDICKDNANNWGW